MKTVVARLAPIFISIVILVAGDFFGGRIYDSLRHKNTEDYFFQDDRVGKRHLPDVRLRVPWPESTRGEILFRTNHRGFREDEETASDAEGRFRILVMGDSHTDGVVNNDESFPNLLEASWPPPSIDVINAGSGHSTIYQQTLLLTSHLDLHPDLVIFTFYTGNDYLEIRQPYSPHPEWSGDSIVDKPAIPRPWTEGWRDVSLMARIFRRFDHSTAMQAERIKGPAMWQSFSQAWKFSVEPAALKEASALHRHALHRIAALARENHFDVLFVVLPTKYQVERDSDKETFEKLEALLALRPSEKMDDRVREDFAGLLAEMHLPYVDPLASFLASVHPDSQPLYWNSEHHLSQRGHRLLAEILTKELRPYLAGHP